MNTASTQKKIIPVLIGADLNCYNVARAFHEAYGVVSHAFGRYEISATMASRIIKFHRVPELDTDTVFLSEMQRFAKEHKGEDTAMILVGCTDDYVNLIARNRATLEGDFVVPYNPASLMDELQSKARFYEYCDKHGILYPKTTVLHSKEDVKSDVFSEEALGFSYPIIVKPSSSVVYWKHPFDGMHKVYVAQDPKEAEEICHTIYASGYDDEMLLQDMIPGNDSHMYVLTAYAGQDKKVKMMCLGHVLLEEHTPKGRGNHAAILTECNPALCEGIRAFLEEIGYVGFANFDIKFDERDGTYRAFEINLRQGRSNFYVTASGENIARYLVGDHITHDLGDTCKLVDTDSFWASIPKSIVWKYTNNDALIKRAKAVVKAGGGHSSLWYKYDLKANPKRLFYVAAAQLRHFKKFKVYCKDYK